MALKLNQTGSLGSQHVEREFHMSYEDFKKIKSLAYKITGISLSDHKQNMIYGRLARRLRVLGLKRFGDYCQLLESGNENELHEFVNSITTNLTSFFREVHHFEFLRDQLLPLLIKTNAVQRRIRIWSAGCSTGEEPHSIAMVLRSCHAIQNWDVRILATDLDSNCVATGTEGIYSPERVETVPAEYKKYIKKSKKTGQVRIADSVRQLIRFKQLNLLHQWPMKGPFDLIFCRNVVIYFDAETQKALFDRYANILQPNGHLFIGHSENLSKVCNRFESLGRTMYQRLS